MILVLSLYVVSRCIYSVSCFTANANIAVIASYSSSGAQFQLSFPEASLSDIIPVGDTLSLQFQIDPVIKVESTWAQYFVDWHSFSQEDNQVRAILQVTAPISPSQFQSDFKLNFVVVSSRAVVSSDVYNALIFYKQQAFESLYVNCGPSQMDSEGRLWVSDSSYAIGGSIYTSSSLSIASSLAISERYWKAASVTNYSGEHILVSNSGIYNVTVYLAEIYFESVGKRSMNIRLNGLDLFSSFIDIFAYAGFEKLVGFTMILPVTSHQISIIVIPGVENPKMSAFSIEFLSDLSSNAPSQPPSDLDALSPAKDLCKSMTLFDDFSSGSLGSKLDISSWCNSGIFIGPNSASSSNLSLTMSLPKYCGATQIASKDSFSGGYFETSLRLGGQGDQFNGVVFAWYLRESDASASNSNEIDFEWLGKSSKAGITQTNWFINGIGASKNELFSSAAPRFPYNQFEKYAIWWNQSVIEWYINDRLVRQEKNTELSVDRHMKLYISIWDGSTFPTWAGVIDWDSPSLDQFHMEINYIRVCTL